MVLSATTGVETDTVRAWDYAVELQMPRMAFINKMDVDGADFFGTIERMRELFGKAIMPLQIPIGEGANFEGVIDVAKMTAFYLQRRPTNRDCCTGSSYRKGPRNTGNDRRGRG